VAVGEIKAGLARANVWLRHLVGIGRKLFGREAEQKEKQLSM